MIRLALTLCAAGGVLVSLRLALRPLATVGVPVDEPAVALAAVPPLVRASARLSDTLDPFRFGHHPAGTRYDPATPVQALAPQPPRPALVLDGIAWTTGDPLAVLEGLPGSSGPRVVRPGDAVGGLTVRRIAADRVIVTGMDTTWTLTVRKP